MCGEWISKGTGLEGEMVPQGTGNCQIFPKSASPWPLLTWCWVPCQSRGSDSQRGCDEGRLGYQQLPSVCVPTKRQSTGHPAGGAHVQTLRGTCTSQTGSRGADPLWLRSSSSSQGSLQTLFDGDDYYYILYYEIYKTNRNNLKYQEKEKPA